MKKIWNMGIIVQVTLLALAGLALIGIITNLSQRRMADTSIKMHGEAIASEMASEVVDSVCEYPAYRWYLRYWYEHSDEMDVVYDEEFVSGTVAEEKFRLFSDRYPDFLIQYAGEEALDALPAEDQKLVAEIVYSWTLTRVNQIKRNFGASYLYCVVTDEGGAAPYQEQVFLVSGADPDAVRGTAYHEVYTLGTRVSIADNPVLQDAMKAVVDRQKSAKSGGTAGRFEYSGSYADYYAYLDAFDGHVALVGVSYKLSAMTEQIQALARQGTIRAVLLQALLVALILIHLIFYVIRPLKKVLWNIRRYTEDKDSGKVEESLSAVRKGRAGAMVRNNEIGQLSEDFITLTHEMDEYAGRIRLSTAAEERIGTELDTARKIQAAVLPSVFPPFPDRHEFDIYAAMEPAKAVGGDFYDFFLIDQDHLCMVIADVSDKGIPAALFMMICKAILQNCAMLGRSPSEILRKTNEAICSNNPESMFVTAWVGILEISTGRLVASNGGHEYPAVYRAKSGAFQLLQDRHGFVLGGMKESVYREYELQLEPGDRIFVYTDGVTDATNDFGNMFGLDRMLAALNRDPSAGPEQILRNVRQAVDGFVYSAEQFDDLTMLCMAYRGPGA